MPTIRVSPIRRTKKKPIKKLHKKIARHSFSELAEERAQERVERRSAAKAGRSSAKRKVALPKPVKRSPRVFRAAQGLAGAELKKLQKKIDITRKQLKRLQSDATLATKKGTRANRQKALQKGLAPLRKRLKKKK